MSKLDAVKIAHKRIRSSITVRRFFSFWTILGLKLEIVAGLFLSLFPARLFVKKIQYVDKKWSTSFAGIVLIFNFSYRYLTISGEECSDQ